MSTKPGTRPTIPRRAAATTQTAGRRGPMSTKTAPDRPGTACIGWSSRPSGYCRPTSRATGARVSARTGMHLLLHAGPSTELTPQASASRCRCTGRAVGGHHGAGWRAARPRQIRGRPLPSQVKKSPPSRPGRAGSSRKGERSAARYVGRIAGVRGRRRSERERRLSAPYPKPGTYCSTSVYISRKLPMIHSPVAAGDFRSKCLPHARRPAAGDLA
jgi:hypothetical protein